MGLFDRDDSGRTVRDGDAPKQRAPEPGKYAGTDNYGSGGPSLIPSVPGKRSGTDQLDAPTSAYGAGTQPSMRAPGVGKYALSAYGAGDPAGAAPTGGSGHQAPRASRENFEISAWTAGASEPPMRVGTPASGDQTSIAVQATGIAANATVRALTPEAQQYSVGYVQTIHSSRRQAVYESEPGVVAATWLETRGTMLDQRTDLGSPAPWYNYGLSLGSAARSPGMADNPVVVVPEYSEDFALLARLEGSESFTTYLVAMVGSDSSTIVYLGNVHWSVTWTGRFNEAYTTFSGGRGTVGAATRSADGGATLSGPAANHGTPGGFTSGGGGRSRGGAHAWGAYGSAAATHSRYGADEDAHIQELRTQIDQAWAQMLTTAEADVSEAGLARWKLAVYRRLITEPAAPSTIPSLLAYLGADPTKAGLNTAATTARDSFNLDRPRIANLQRSTNQFIGGGQASEASIALMADYPNVTSLGRSYISELPWVNALETYAARSAREDGDRLASGAGEARTQQTRTMLGILRGHGTGIFQTAPDAQPAAPGAQGTPGTPAAPASTWTPAKEADFQRLRRLIVDVCPEPHGHDQPRDVDYTQMQNLTAQLRQADREVQDHLTADAALTRRMQASLSGWSMQQLASSMDSVQSLVTELQGTLPEGRTQYNVILDYLNARRGAGPDDAAARDARMRVINNATIGGIIAGFDATKHATILRLATRGTTERDPVDDIYDAARGAAGITAETALRAMMRMRANRTQLDDLQANPLFRDAIQHLQTAVTVDGLSCSPYDYMMRLWGFNPRETGDPAAARPTEVNPDGNTEPLSPENWRTIDTLFNTTVNLLVGRLARPTVLLFTDSWTSDSAVVNILTGFENACAQDPMRGLLRRGHIMPGQELTQRANARSEIQDIRERLHRCVGEDARQQCERVLNIRIDAAAVGQVGGSVRTAQDGIGAPDGTGHVPLAQAIREVMINGMAITQAARACAVTIAESLATHWYRATRRDPGESKNAWHAFRDAVNQPRTKQELNRLTGIAEVDIHPIEFLVNIFHEVPNGGDLATRITTCTTEATVQDTLHDFGLQPAQVAERAVRHGEAPPEATPADRFGQPATHLWQAIRSWNVPIDDVTAFTPSGLDAVAQKFSAGMQVAGPPGGAATAQPQAPRVVEGPLPGEHQPARVDGNSDAPATFAAYYRSTYGIDPDRHVIEFGRSVLRAAAQKRDSILHPRVGGQAGSATREPTEEERQRAETWNITPQALAGYLHVEAAQFSAAVAAPAARAEVTDANRAQLPVGYSPHDAEVAARAIWDHLRGDGDVVLIRDQINGKRAEEVRLINIEFRRLSGDIDLSFYLRQSADDRSGTWGLSVGGDGVREAGQASSTHTARALGDLGSMIETADLAQTNRIGILTRVRNACGRSDKNELFRVVGEATPTEKRQVLGDPASMDAIRQNCSETEFDRVFADLNGTLDLAGMLWSHSSEASTWGTTDTQGMQADIRNYMERRREFHTRALEQGGGEVDQQEVERRVREDALRAYSNPSVRTVIETECRSLFRSGPNSDAHQMTGMIMNAGTDPGTGALLGNNWANVGELVTAIRAMQPAQRARWRNDPEFWMRVDALSPTDTQRQEIVSALNGSEANGSDHLDVIRQGLRAEVGENEMKEALAHLSAAEIQRLQGDPTLVAQLQSRFQFSEEMRTILATLLGSRHGADAATDLGAHPRMGPDGHTPMVDAQGRPIYDLPSTTAAISTEEIERLEALKTSAIVRLRYGAERSWEQLLREAVEVFRMDFRPTAMPPSPAAQAQAQATQPATSATATAPTAPGPQRRQTDAPASTYRHNIWQAISEVIRSKADDDGKHHTIDEAVHGRQDPSETLMREFLGTFNDSESDILATIRGASNDLIVDRWSSVKNLKYLGSDGFNYSYKTAYDTYKNLRDHQPPPPAGAAGAPPPQSSELQTARLNFQRYRIEPSAGFETLLLSHAGNDAFDLGGPAAARQYRTHRDDELHRDNPEWHQWRDALLEKINGLSADDKLRGLEAESDPDARALVGSRLATAEQSFQRAQEDHAFQRGDGNSFFGDEHGRELDRAFGDYGTALGQGEDSTRRTQAQTGRTTDITDAQGRALGRYDAAYTQRSAEYAQAREEAAHWAGLVVAAVIGVAVTALTAGAGGVAMVAMWGAISGAAAATGDTLTHEMILGRTYDASGEGLRNIATGAVTGMVAAGSQFYAGQIIRSLSGVATEATGTALQQATRVAGVAEQTAPGWRAMFQQAGRGAVTAGVQTGLTGFANAAGTMLSPDIWVHGWDEGWVRAQISIGAQLRAIPMDVLRTTVSTMLASIRRPGPETSLGTVQAGQQIGADRVLAEIVHQLPQNLRQGAIDAALQGQTSPQALAGGAAQQGLMGMRDVGQGLHDGSAQEAHAVRFAQRELLAHGTEFVNQAEALHYIQTVIGGHDITAREYLTARESVARAYMNGSTQPLSEVQRTAFIRWCREAPSAEQFRQRMQTNPGDVEAVRNAGTTTPPAADGSAAGTGTGTGGTGATTTVDPHTPAGQARQHAQAAQQAVEHGRAASEAAIRAEDAYHANRSAESGQHAITEIRAAETTAREQVAAAQRAVDALQGMLATVPADQRAAVEQELARARESLLSAMGIYNLIHLTLTNVQQEVNPTEQHRTPDAQPHPQGGTGTDAHPPQSAREQLPRPESMSPEQWMLLQHLVAQHGNERGLHEWRNIVEGRNAEGIEINATIIAGSGFIGTGRATAEPVQVKAEGHAQFPSLVGLFAGQVTSISAPSGDVHTVTLADGTTMRVTIRSTQLSYVEVARSQVNTQRGEHTIFLSDRVAASEIQRALAHELGEILAETRNSRSGDVPTRVDALHSGDHTGGSLSAHDWGRCAEINLLAQQLRDPSIDAAAQARIRRELFAMVAALGLREGTPGARERRQLLANQGALGGEAVATLFNPTTGLARPEASLSDAERGVIADIASTAASRDQAQLDADRQRRESGLDPLTPRPDQLLAGRVPLAEQRRIAQAEAQARQVKSDQTIAWLWQQHAAAVAAGQPLAEITIPVWLGGGAGATGLTPETLFIDARGRWQEDQAAALAQTAQQVQGLHQAGMGDPHQFATPDARVPMPAVRALEDHLAAQAKCVNGRFTTETGPDGRMVVTITPSEGSADMRPIRFILGGAVTMSPGVPRERVPGEAFGQAPSASVTLIRQRLQAAGVDPATILGARMGTTDADAVAVAGLLRGASGNPAVAGVLADPEVQRALNSLDAVGRWDAAVARDQAAGERRVLRGDEACRAQDFATNPITEWVIAGTGGVAISAAEVILQQTRGRRPPVIVRMFGGGSAEGLQQNTQWVELLRLYGPAGENRLHIDFGIRINDMSVDSTGAPTGLSGSQTDASGTHAWSASGGGVIVALGSRGVMPEAIEAHVHQAMADQAAGQPVTVVAQMMWGRDAAPTPGTHPPDVSPGRYLGYRITVTRNGRTQTFEVTGARSRTLPSELFTTAAAQQMVDTAGTVDASSTSGNFAPGMVSTASQASDYRARGADGTLYIMNADGTWP